MDEDVDREGEVDRLIGHLMHVHPVDLDRAQLGVALEALRDTIQHLLRNVDAGERRTPRRDQRRILSTAWSDLEHSSAFDVWQQELLEDLSRKLRGTPFLTQRGVSGCEFLPRP